MKIRSIELINFKKFVGTVRVGAIGDHVNVLAGPNELGKSTLLEAINGVIFEKARSTASHVKAFRHFANGTVPEVKLAVDVDDKSWVIHKRFAGQNGKSVLTCSNGKIFEDDAAESELQRLLGFHGGRCGGEPGIWGTLWVRQGQSFGDETPNEHAQRTIQGCLEAQVGMVTGGARGQKIPRAVREALDAVRSQRGPRGAFKDAVDRLASADAEVAELGVRAKSVSDLLVALSANRRELKRTQTSWDDSAHRAELESERNKRVVAATVALEIARAHDAARLARERADNRNQAFQDRLQTIEDLARLELERASLGQDIQSVRTAKDEARAVLEAAERALTALRTGARSNAEEARKLERVRGAVALDAEIVLRQAALDQASTLECDAIRLTESIAAIAATDETVRRIEDALTELSAAEAAADAVSTTISFDVREDARSRIRIGVRQLSDGDNSFSILEPTTIAIAGIGAIAVEPQIKNLSTLLKRRQDAKDALASALSAAGAVDLGAARVAAARRRDHERSLAQIRKELASVAPGDSRKRLAPGIEPLRTYVSALRGKLKLELDAVGLETLPLDDALTATIATTREAGENLAREIATQEASLSGPKVVLAEAEKQLRKREDRSTELKAMIGARNADLATARANFGDDVLAEESRGLARDADDKEQEHAEKEKAQGESVEAIDARIGRLEAAASNHQNAIASLTNEITRLTALVHAQEGLGIEEQILTQQARRDLLRQAVADHERESAVLELLLETLETAEREAKNRYLAPVVQRVRPYLKMVFPECDIVFDEDLRIAGLKREGQTEDYGVLSGGTQEQLAVLSRIAFAELLRGQNRPATVILDDALAFSDDDRIENMFDVLMRAGENVQIIVLTCRKKLFARLGAVPLELHKVCQSESLETERHRRRIPSDPSFRETRELEDAQ